MDTPDNDTRVEMREATGLSGDEIAENLIGKDGPFADRPDPSLASAPQPDPAVLGELCDFHQAEGAWGRTVATVLEQGGRMDISISISKD